jgi:creatinine amidohydrolase
MPDRPIAYWQSMTTVEARGLAGRDPVIVLPLAAIEQHGPHLPLSTDLDIGLGLLTEAFRRLPEGFPAMALPPQAVGTSREHARFAGTISLDPALLSEIIVRNGAALAGCGVRRLVICNSHGGNRQAIDAAGLTLRQALGLLVVKVSYADLPRPDGLDLPDAEWRHGLHGGAVETAMMLHLRPDLVRRDAIRAEPSVGEELEVSMRKLSPDGEVSFSWLAGDLNPTGVTGDARRADAAMGRRLVAHYGEALADVIRDAKEFPLTRLT